ncbi:MAG TPA: amidohydrolase family protein, partial [Candidatus Brocadiales bacterium]|nr:amidohydrolase family protein [Candidatus Brocadiales bacterium]
MGNYTSSNLILYNANVLTMDTKNPKAEAVAIAEDKISFVGQNNEIHQVCFRHPSHIEHGQTSLSMPPSSTKSIDLKGKTIVPGFVDSHVHFVQRGLQLLELDLRDTCSIDDVLSKLNVKVREAGKGKWIIGY